MALTMSFSNCTQYLEYLELPIVALIGTTSPSLDLRREKHTASCHDLASNCLDENVDAVCTPVNRIWPTDKCEACTKAGLPCSANLTASEAREEDPGASPAERTRAPVPAGCSHAPRSKRSLAAHQFCTQSGGALLSAVIEGHFAVVQLLLEAGANVGERSEAYGHSLEVAAAQGNLETVKILLNYGADINQAGVNHVNALQASSIHGHAEVVRYLLDHGAKLSSTAHGAAPPRRSLQPPNTEAIEKRPERQTAIGSPATHAQAQVSGPPRYRESPIVSSSTQDRVSIGRGTAPQRNMDDEENASEVWHPLPFEWISASAVTAYDVMGASNDVHPQLSNASSRSLDNPFELGHYILAEVDSARHDFSLPPFQDFVRSSVCSSQHSIISSRPRRQVKSP
ncbi:MAG: hypothetical protein Q9208_007395 [Pyrenodesmia sp. 3 TL-2023]